jgi:hypothetical protein
MSDKTKRMLHCLHPPDGCQVRKLIGLIIILTGLVRIFGTDPALARRSTEMIAVYGVAQVIVGLALLLTNHDYRNSMLGRIVAALGVGLLTVLIIQFWPYPTGFAYIAFAGSLLVEVTTHKPCYCKFIEQSGIVE